MAPKLRAIGIHRVRGFMLNATHMDWTAKNIRYGRRLSRRVGGKPFIVNTSHNGNGPLHRKVLGQPGQEHLAHRERVVQPAQLGARREADHGHRPRAGGRIPLDRATRATPTARVTAGRRRSGRGGASERWCWRVAPRGRNSSKLGQTPNLR